MLMRVITSLEMVLLNRVTEILNFSVLSISSSSIILTNKQCLETAPCRKIRGEFAGVVNS